MKSKLMVLLIALSMLSSDIAMAGRHSRHRNAWLIPAVIGTGLLINEASKEKRTLHHHHYHNARPQARPVSYPKNRVQVLDQRIRSSESQIANLQYQNRKMSDQVTNPYLSRHHRNKLYGKINYNNERIKELRRQIDRDYNEMMLHTI